MKEKETLCLRDGAINHIHKQTGVQLDQLRQRIKGYMDQGLSKDEIYRLLMTKKGVPHSHCSGFEDGDPISNSRYTHLRRLHRRKR